MPRKCAPLGVKYAKTTLLHGGSSKWTLRGFYHKLMCKRAVDRSQGQLVDISICHCNDELLSYVANRSRQLRRLEIVLHYGDVVSGISRTLMKFPFLEEFNLYSTGISWNESWIVIAGPNWPMLKTLKLNKPPFKDVVGDRDNDIAIAIGENLPEIRHLDSLEATCRILGCRRFSMAVFALKHLTCVTA